MCNNLFKLYPLFVIWFIIVTVSCRDESDDVMSYAYDDFMIFAESNASLVGQFDAIWTSMNCNYPIWDFEEDKGLNWDEVYDIYKPRFKELDKMYGTTNPIPDSIVVNIYDSIFAPLHDGHLYMYLKNIHTDKKIRTMISPQIARTINNNADSITSLLELLYLTTSFKPSLDYYEEQGKITEIVQENDYIYAQFKDGIVYFRIPEFNLIESFDNKDYDIEYERICSLWEIWFNCIQKLHFSKELKGVVFDVRNNFGGMAYDYQYLLGALIHGDKESHNQWHTVGYLREKSGIGRRDYTMLQPFSMPILAKEHASINAPIVILSNSFTVSTGEIMSLSAKQLENGYVIGTKTYGAFSPSVNSFALTYSGDVGDPALEETEESSSYFAPFYIHIPSAAFLSKDKKIIEGSGIEPNEIIHLDWVEHMKTGKDNQLERAIEYIHSVN